MNRGECEIIRDLIGLNGRESRASTRMISQHIRQCAQCREYYARARGEFHLDMPMPRIWDALDTQQRYLRWSIVTLAFLATVISRVVNFAVEPKLTWGWIVAGAMLTIMVPVLVYIQTFRLRFIKAMACFTVLTFLLLGLTQYVIYRAMHMGGVWLWAVGIPVAALWLGALWAGILFTMLLRRNGFFCLALILLLFIPADIATGALTSAYLATPFTVHWMSLTLYFIAAVTAWVMGMCYEAYLRKRS